MHSIFTHLYRIIRSRASHILPPQFIMTSLHSLCTVTSWLVPYKIPLFTLARHIFSHVLRTTDFMITVFLQQFAIMSQTTKCVLRNARTSLPAQHRHVDDAQTFKVVPKFTIMTSYRNTFTGIAALYTMCKQLYSLNILQITSKKTINIKTTNFL